MLSFGIFDLYEHNDHYAYHGMTLSSVSVLRAFSYWSRYLGTRVFVFIIVHAHCTFSPDFIASLARSSHKI